VEEYTCEFERLVMICDLRENEDQTIVRYLEWLNDPIRNVVELQHYTTLDEVCSPTHKVEQQKKAKLKKELPKPPQRAYPFNKKSLSHTPKPTNTPTSSSLPKPNTSKPPLNPFEKRTNAKVSDT